MQKICFILFGIIITTGAFAADLCVRNDAMVVAMNPMLSGTTNGYDELNKTWSTKFSYGVLSGVAGCAPNFGDVQGMGATNQNIGIYTKGEWCYCKMLTPAPSNWVFGVKIGGVNSAPDRCLAGCAQQCASLVGSALALRRALFRSINEMD